MVLELPSLAAVCGREPLYLDAVEIEGHNFEEDGDSDEEFMDVDEGVEAVQVASEFSFLG